MPDLLTPAERAWLAAHPEILLGVGQEWAPAVVRDAQGRFAGFALDHIDLLNRKLGTNLRLEAGPWNEIVEQAESGRLAGLTLSAPLEQRKAYFLFTQPFHTVQYFIYLRSRQSAPKGGLDGFRGQRVGYLKGLLALRNLLAAHPALEVVPMDNSEALAHALLRGEVDAVVDSYGLEYWRASHGLMGFVPVQMLPEGQIDLVISVRKDWPELVEILNKGLAAITREEMVELYRRWFGQDYLSHIASRVTLTAEEQTWLAAHPVIRVGLDPSWAPVEFVDAAGVAQGISIAYLKRLEKSLGVRFEIARDVSWVQALQRLTDRTLDLLPALVATPERQRLYHFTEPYLSFPAAIFSAAEVAYLGNLNALKGRTVVVVQDEATQTWLREEWPELTLLPVTETQQALQKVAAGEAFAFVGNLVTTSYYIGQSGLTQIRVVGETPYTYRLGMGVRQDWPMLAGILQKGLDAIPQSERDSIYHDWISIHYEHGVDYTLLGQVLAAATLIPLLIFFWNRRLALEVGRRRQAEASMREAKEAAERADRAKSDFLANMSHELRTPLNAVLGFAQLLEQDRQLDHAQHRHIRAIRRSSERLMGLVNEVLDLAKIEAGRFDLMPSAWNSAEFFQELAGMFRLRAEQKGIDFRIEPSVKLPQTLFCDVNCLHQILVNLLDNAIKYTEQGAVTLCTDFADGHLLLEVADTGIGIPPAQREAIFEPFQRAGHAGHRAPGTGLGLAITKALVVRMGGTIAVDSVPRQGSTFRVHIPAQAVARPVETMLADQPTAGSIIGHRHTQGQGTLRILVVDDEPENREILRRLLEWLGFVVEEAASGRSGVEKAQVWAPDLILMDLRMPDMDGLEATRTLRALPAFQDTPIVAVTAAAFAEDRALALAAGCNAHLVKPVLLETLTETLAALLPLAWVRSESKTEVEAPLELEALSPEQAEQLARLVSTGSVTAIKALAQDLTREGGCPVLARRLGALADEFDTTGLRRLVEAIGGCK